MAPFYCPVLTLSRLWVFTLFAALLTSFFDSDHSFITHQNTMGSAAAYRYETQPKAAVNELNSLRQYTAKSTTSNQTLPIIPFFYPS